ncbi:unnamed protein product [Parnassius apollo]|uniref:(apollo) hypothetical protein n=1 Tax=Parnassius apollo TaxID=110799 RepID=A0A8S3X3S4_PARAO|nr:unnamed protein product [Parnassius apollo]
MFILDDYWKKKCFMEIISGIPISQNESIPVWLCWECQAVIARFIKFKHQVIQSFKIFQNYLKENLDLTQIKHMSKLCTEEIINMTIQPEIVEFQDLSEKVIKTEEWEFIPKTAGVEVKEEDNASIFSNIDEDDKALIEVVKRRKKKSHKVVNGNTKKRKENTEPEVFELFKEIELSKEELEEERKILAGKEDFVNAMFRCEKCIVSFPNADDLKDHINLKHELNATNYKCETCECSFSNEVSYNYHVNRHTKRFQCVICEERFGSKRSASKHYGLVHCHSVHYEYVLNKTFNGKSKKPEEDTEHNSNEEAPSFPCEVCAKTFRWKTSLRKHLEKHRIETGQKRKPYCEPCRLSFTTTSNLQKHVKTSSKHQIQLKLRKLKESLPEDNASPEKQQARIEQIKCLVNSERQQFPCPQCGKRFQWRGNLLRHLHSHAARAKGELVCEPCNRTFSSIATYQQHMKISKKHVSENDFKYMCSDCGKRFANKTRLKDHVDWEHLKNYVHKCGVCQKYTTDL